MLNYVETKLEIKSMDLKARTFEASATGIGNIDYGLDKFVPGAFTRTINNKVNAGKVKFVDAHFYKYGELPRGNVPSVKFIFGKVLSAVETSTDLLIKIYVSDTPDGNDLLTKIKDGVVDALSVGYIPIKVSYEKEEDGRVIRLLEEVKLMEVSAVIWGMNDRATIDATSVKSVMGVQNFPLAKEATPWNAEEAIKRLETKAAGDLKEFRRFFLHFDGDDITDVKSYKYPYCDVIDDAVVIVPKAIYAAAKAIKKDGINIPKVNEQLERWTEKMDKKPEFKAVTFDGTLSEEIAQNGIWRLNNTFNETLMDIHKDEDVDDKEPLIKKALDSYGQALAGLLLDTKSAKLTSDENCFTIQAKAPLIALLNESKAHGNEPVPPNSDETRYVSEDKANEIQTKVRELKLSQIKGVHE